MPEQNFEQQARDMANNFSMEPNPAVWQRVEAVIAPPKRKRRILIWWWFLPVLIAGSFAVLFKNNKQQNEKTEVVKEQKVKAWKDKTEPSVLIKPNGRTGQINAIKNSRNTITNETAQQNITGVRKAFYQKNKADNKPVQKSKEIEVSNTFKSSEKDVLDLKNDVAANIINKKSDSLENNSGINLLNDTDKLNEDKKLLFAHADSLGKKNDSTSIVISTKKTKNKKWQFGVLGEMGASISGNSLFKSSTVNNAFSAGASSPGTLDNLSNSTSIISSTIKNGIYASAGISAKRKLSKKIFISGSLSYQYAQLTVTQNLKDSISAPANTQTAIFYSVNEKQKFQFININAGLGLQLLKWKRSNLSLEAGFDNSLLIKASQNKTGLTQRLDSLTSLSTANFYRWQPYFTTALSFNVDVSKTKQLQLSPIMHFSLKNFQKNDANSKNNHLTSAGIQVIYFFK